MAKKSYKKKSKLKKSIKKILFLIIAFIILSISSLFLAPTEEEFQKTKESNEIKTQIIDNLEMPKAIANEQIIYHTGFALSYNEKYEQPSYVAYKLTQNELYGPNERKNNFREDPNVNTGSATLNDYKKSGYDRGHLCPAADQKESKQAMSDSFFMSNMSPQAPDFNRGIWADLEATVRTFADNNKTIYVATGPILTDGPYKTIGNNKVAVPNYYYKVILDYTNPEIKSIAFILPNEKGNKSLQSYATTVNKVEKLTNIDFFTNLPDNQEEIIESSYDTSKWEFKEFLASSGKGSFDNEVDYTENTTTNDISQKIKDATVYIFVQLRKETMKIVTTYIPKDFLKTVGII